MNTEGRRVTSVTRDSTSLRPDPGGPSPLYRPGRQYSLGVNDTLESFQLTGEPRNQRCRSGSLPSLQQTLGTTWVTSCAPDSR